MDHEAARRFLSAVTDAAAARAPSVDADADGVARVVLVEGRSDLAAVEACAGTLGRDLGAEGVLVVSMNGATNLPRYLRLLGPAGLRLPLAGLVDVQEVPLYVGALADAGMSGPDSPLEEAGFFACVRDLEDELLRALGVDAAIDVVRAVGDGGRFERMRRQPAQRERARVDQLHRFVGTAAGRKAVLARAFAERLPAERIPAPLRDLLAVTAS